LSGAHWPNLSTVEERLVKASSHLEQIVEFGENSLNLSVALFAEPFIGHLPDEGAKNLASDGSIALVRPYDLDQGSKDQSIGKILLLQELKTLFHSESLASHSRRSQFPKAKVGKNSFPSVAGVLLG